jgi:hypothetical protein
MPLSEEQAELIIVQLRSYDVETRLKAINDARESFKNTFAGEMTDSQWAYSAYVVEQLYNLIREELRVSHIRIKTDKAEAKAAASKKTVTKKVKKDAPKTMEMGDLIAAFAAFKKETVNEPTKEPIKDNGFTKE